MISKKSLSAAKNNNIAVYLSLALLTASTILNVLLAQKINNLTNTLDEIKAESRLNEGEVVPLFEAKDLFGKSIVLNFSESTQPTVLYVFTPQCHWCSENLENIKALTKEIRGKYRLVGLSLNKDGLDEYLQKTKLDFPVYTDVSSNTKSAYKFGGTPQTLVISSEGKVIKNWIGVYTDDVGAEIADYFKITLQINL